MCSCQYRHLIRQSLLPSFEIIDIKNVCVLDHFGCHQPYDLPQMTVATFRYLALAFMFTRLVNRRIKPAMAMILPERSN